MDDLVSVSLVSLLVLLVAGIILVLVLQKKRDTRKMKNQDYQIYFALGFALFPIGLVYMLMSLILDVPVTIGIPFAAVGIVFLIIGWSKRNKWKRIKITNA